MTTQRDIADGLGLPIHPPKSETFDLENGTNTDPKRYVRAVDMYRSEPFGLYLARPVVNHPKLHYLESWLLPTLDLRVSTWHGLADGASDFYVDIVDIETGARQWHCVDYYLDISVRPGQAATLLDIDEFLLAVQASVLDTATAQRVLETAYQVVDELARYHYDLDEWLLSKSITLSWATQSP